MREEREAEGGTSYTGRKLRQKVKRTAQSYTHKKKDTHKKVRRKIGEGVITAVHLHRHHIPTNQPTNNNNKTFSHAGWPRRV